MKENFSYCHVAGLSDVGMVRKVNEDSMATFQSQNGLVTVVCDGMGGHVGGATASETAIKAITDYLVENFEADPCIAIEKAIKAANNAIINKAESDSELKGMGSTCVILLIRKGWVYYGHVGDSRIYLVRDHQIKQLTKDHSYVQELVDSGKITNAEAASHPRKNEITNALGFADMGTPSVCNEAIRPKAGDCFLLCSDGLTNMIPDEDIEAIISQQKTLKAQERAQQLINTANDRGGTDNVTAAIVEFSFTPKMKDVPPVYSESSAPKQHNKKNSNKIWAAACVALVIIIALFFWFRSSNKSGDANRNDTDSTLTEQHDTITFDEVKFKKNATIAELTFTPDYINVVTTKDGKKVTLKVDGRFAQSIDNNIFGEHEQIGMKKNGNVVTLTFLDKFLEPDVKIQLSNGTILVIPILISNEPDVEPVAPDSTNIIAPKESNKEEVMPQDVPVVSNGEKAPKESKKVQSTTHDSNSKPTTSTKDKSTKDKSTSKN